MNDKKLGQESAFPVWTDDMPVEGTPGISKRFYAACAAMQGQIAKQGLSFELNQLRRDIEYAYLYADELLKQENQ